jgi:hypothetical protein
MAVLKSEAEYAVNHFWRICIHMKNWCLHCLHYISAVKRSTILLRHCRKTYLVVHYNMHYASSGIVRKVLKLQAFVNDTLACKGSITVHQYAECPVL